MHLGCMEVIVFHVFFVFPVLVLSAVMGENKEWADDDMFSLGVTEIKALMANMARDLRFRYGRLNATVPCAGVVAGVNPIG